MGRTLMYAAIAALAVFILSATFLLKSGGESVASVQPASVHDLTAGPTRFEGKSVTTIGILGFSEAHDAYQVIGESNFAVLIEGYEDEERLESLLGREVRVSGVFGIGEESGVYIDTRFVGPVAD